MKKKYCNFWSMNLLFCVFVTVVCAEKGYDFSKEEERYQLAVRNELSQKINQKRIMIQQRQKQKTLWNVANIIGPLGLMTLALYQLLTPAPIIMQQAIIEPIQNNDLMVETPPVMQQEKSVSIPQPEVKLFASVVQEDKPLIREDVSKYTQASKAYGAAAVWFTLNALFDPLFYPYVAVTYMGSLYYGIKGLQPRLKPIALEEIVITPDELPY